MIDLLYYRNRSGAVAVSADDGEQVIIPSGRTLPWREAWTEDDGDLRAELSEPQVKAITLAEQEIWAKPQPIWRDDPDVAAVMDSFDIKTPVAPSAAIEELWESLE
jgi:hypothetical protein